MNGCIFEKNKQKNTWRTWKTIYYITKLIESYRFTSTFLLSLSDDLSEKHHDKNVPFANVSSNMKKLKMVC